MLRRSVVAFIAMCSFSQLTQAAIVQFENRAAFESEGSLLFKEDFEGFTDFDNLGYRTIGFVDYELSGVTYLSSTFSNIINAFDGVNSINRHDPISTIYTNGVFGPIYGKLDNSGDPVNQFGFDLAFVNNPAPERASNSDFEITLTSNFNAYSFNVLAEDLQHVAFSSVFFGFGFTDVSEFFTSFSITPAEFGVSPTVDNVTLRTGAVAEPTVDVRSTGPNIQGNAGGNNTNSVPEPALAGLIIIALCSIARKRKHT